MNEMMYLSRRSFLKNAAAMGAAVAGASLLGMNTAKAECAVYTPGTYTATATGFASDVTVTITVDETSILSATVEAAGETAAIGGAAADTLAEQILAAQSQQVDGVSGATKTSDAVRKACESCIAQAKGVDVSLLAAPAEEAAAEDWLGQEPEIADSEIVEIVDTEVLVVGAGHSGSFAACSALKTPGRKPGGFFA